MLPAWRANRPGEGDSGAAESLGHARALPRARRQPRPRARRQPQPASGRVPSRTRDPAHQQSSIDPRRSRRRGCGSATADRVDSWSQLQSVDLDRRLQLPNLIPLGATTRGLKVQHHRELRGYQNVVTAANARQLKPERIGQAQRFVETQIAITALDSRPDPARVDPYLNLETSTSLLVMNSRSAGVPCLVCSMPRRIAGTISSGSVTRSP
jgi:hypothetical protein